MASISIETKMIKDIELASAVGSDNDDLLVRFADETGVKRISLAILSAYFNGKLSVGDVAELATEDKTSVVLAVNEVLGKVTENAEGIAALEEILTKYNSAGIHNAIYRGKYLGASLTTEQATAISTGAFTDLYIGDYWTIGGVNYRIAAFDYYYNTGDTACTTHHVVIVPDTALYSAQMNTTNVVTGGYTGSAMYTANLETAKTTITAAFGSGHILTHRQFLSNAVSNGFESGCAWFDSTVELMTEQNVYGGALFANKTQGTTFAWYHTVDKSQYPLFAMRPDLISNRVTYWLRNVANSTDFASVSAYGHASAYYASNSLGVRPAFSIR